MKDSVIDSAASLTSDRRLLRNVIWNGAGGAGTAVATPLLIHQLGVERSVFSRWH